MTYYILVFVALFFAPDMNRHGTTETLAALPLYGLEAAIRELSVTVIMGSLPTGWWGAFNFSARTVTMRSGLSSAQFRSVLGHELGHAKYGHYMTDSPFSRQESDADRFAANLLIDPAAYSAAVARYGTDIGAVARELDVMTWVAAEMHRETMNHTAGPASRPFIFDMPAQEPVKEYSF